MKHLKVVTKDAPASANILTWPAELKAGPKQAYINALWVHDGTLDYNDV